MNKAAKLAKLCVDNIQHKCNCHEAYKGRGLRDPHCEYCAVGQYILPLARKILNLPEPED